jgi:hypothetical protein
VIIMATICLYGRLAFPHLVEPRPSPDGKPAKYECTLLVDPKSDVEGQAAEVKQYSEECLKVAAAKFGSVDAAKAVLQNRPIWKNGNARENPPEGYEDHLYITARSKRQPKFFDKTGQEISAAEADDLFYAGCYVQIIVGPWAYAASGNRGVSHELYAVRFCRRGTSLIGRPQVTASSFKALSSTDDEMPSGVDDIL